MIVYLTLWAHLHTISNMNFMNPVLYDWYIYIYIYMNALCELNRILSVTKTLLLDHYRMPYYKSY